MHGATTDPSINDQNTDADAPVDPG